MTASVDWYFDFVSPYSYLCLHRLKQIPAPIVYKPVLFAGLLNHWGQKGPAEIPSKRRWTYRWGACRAPAPPPFWLSPGRAIQGTRHAPPASDLPRRRGRTRTATALSTLLNPFRSNAPPCL